MRTRTGLLTLLVLLSSCLVTGSADAGWAAVTKKKRHGTKYIARTHAGCWYGPVPVLLCSQSQSAWTGNVVSHCGPKSCLPGSAEAHAYNGTSGSGGWSTKKWLGFAGVSASPDALGAQASSSADLELVVDDAIGAVVLRFREGRLAWSSGAESEIELIVGYATDDGEEPDPETRTFDDDDTQLEDPRLDEVLFSGAIRVRSGQVEALGDLASAIGQVRESRADDGTALHVLDLTDLEFVVALDPARDRDDLIVALRGDSGAGEVPAVRAPVFVRADSNGDGRVDLGDAVFTLGYQFLGGRAPACVAAADANDDGRVDLGDAVFTLGYQFLGGTAPRAPFPGCGVSATSAALSCERTLCAS